MGKYSLLTDPDADEVVEQEVALITNDVVRHFKGHLTAILLTGGFGRGEGSILQTDSGYRALNDYDLILVVNSLRKIPARILETLPALGEQLDRKVSVKQVDLELKEAWKLALPSPTVGRYEIKHGHKIVYGRLPYKISSFPAQWLPLFEGTKYFRNRAGGLLIARLLLDGKGVFDDDQRGELAWMELNKAALAMGDAHLLRQRRYHYSYRVRRDRIDELVSVQQEIRENFRAAIEAKLRPSPALWELDLLENKWHRITGLFLQSFLDFESRRIDRKFPDLRAYEKWGQSRGKRRIVSYWLSTEDSPKHIRQRLIMMRLLQGATRESQADLETAASFLNIGIDGKPLHESWQSLTKAILKQWHPAGIALQM